MSHSGYVRSVSRLRPHLPSILVLLGVALAVLWPAVIAGGGAIPGNPQSDAYEHLHGYAWVARSLRQGEFPWVANDFGLPDGGVLWFPDLLGALLTLPVNLLFGAPAAYTVGLVMQVWAALLGGYALGLRVSAERAPALLAAVIFGASPFVLGLVHSGVSEYLHLVAFPLLWVSGGRAMKEGGRAMVPAILAWAWLGWANAYYALFGAFILPLAWFSQRDVSLVSAMRRYVGIALGAAVLTLPVLLAIRTSVAAPDALLREDSAPGWDWVFLPANDLAGFFVGGDHLFPDFRSGGNFGIRHVTYLGWVAILCALPAWRRWWRPALLAGVLALGPSLHWRGQPVRVAGQVVPLPAALLYVPGSPFRAVHHPYRLTVLPMLVLAAAAADSTRRRPKLALAAAAFVLAETFVVSPGPWPIETASLSGVARLSGAGGVWDLPVDFRQSDRRWMGLQAVHGRPIPYTINVFLPASWRENALYQATMACYEHPEKHTVARDARPPLAVWLLHDSPQTLSEGIEQVRGWGIGFVVLHGDAMKPKELRCLARLMAETGAAEVPQADPELRAFELPTSILGQGGSAPP